MVGSDMRQKQSIGGRGDGRGWKGSICGVRARALYVGARPWHSHSRHWMQTPPPPPSPLIALAFQSLVASASASVSASRRAHAATNTLSPYIRTNTQSCLWQSRSLETWCAAKGVSSQISDIARAPAELYTLHVYWFFDSWITLAGIVLIVYIN